MRNHPLFDWRLFIALLLIGLIGAIHREWQKGQMPAPSPNPSELR